MQIPAIFLKRSQSHWRGLVLLIVLALFLNSCSEADTLGNEDPDEVVITGIPTWNDGIGQLVRLKCANCHSVPANDFTPNDTPNDLNLNVYATVGTTRGASSIGSWINSGILDKNVVSGSSTIRQMPLDYSLQLTDREKDSLRDWVSNGLREK